MVISLGFYFFSIFRINREYKQRYYNTSEISLRKFPYPYRAAISINSDIDYTGTVEEFLEIHKFLNTNELTSMGEGLGLELGNSFLFYEIPDHTISYFEKNSEISKNISCLINSGYIDTMHSYGKKTDFERDDAIDALKELRNKKKITVWVDHTISKDNLGDDVTYGLGDHPGSKEYHADITLKYGIRFVWLGRVTMVAGQTVPITIGTFTSIFDRNKLMSSIINILKEFTKNFISTFGNKKYQIHRNNELVRISELDDKQNVYEFVRFDNYWAGVGTGADSKKLSYVISNKTLNHLKQNGGYMIVYTHLGKNSDCSQYICKNTQEALRNLSNEYREGNIFVTTTSKLLNYYVNHKYLKWSYEIKEGVTNIYIHNISDPIFGIFVPTVNELEGITFYVKDVRSACIFINKKKILNVQLNPKDHTGRESITIPLTFLQYPVDCN